MNRRMTTLSSALIMLPLGCAKAADGGEQAMANRLLLEQFEKAAKAAVNTPGMESTFHAKEPRALTKATMLRGEKPATDHERAEARRYFQDRLEVAQAGPLWPTPATFDIPFTANAPRIDGSIDDPVWKNAATFNQTYRLNSSEPQQASTTTWKVLWDRQYLYLAFECADTNVQAPTFDRDGFIYSADCVEMFILPWLETGIYWEIIISPGGSVYDGLQAKKMNAWGQQPCKLVSLF